MNVEEKIEILKAQIRKAGKQIRWFRKYGEQFKSLPDGTYYGAAVDFDGLSHDQVIKVIRALGGKWKKSLNLSSEGRVDYQTEIDGQVVRCWRGQPPPSCKIVEVEELVPAVNIPARIVKVKKMICIGQGNEPVVDEIQKAQNHANANANTTDQAV